MEKKRKEIMNLEMSTLEEDAEKKRIARSKVGAGEAEQA